jgi:hypothetical protein
MIVQMLIRWHPKPFEPSNPKASEEIVTGRSSIFLVASFALASLVSILSMTYLTDEKMALENRSTNYE